MSENDSTGGPEGLRFECTECGECCRVRGKYAHVYVNDAELQALAEFFSMTKQRFRERYTFLDSYGWTQLAFDGERCVFLDEKGERCTVYSARPTQCRTFPFWRNLVEDGRWTEEVKNMCEGIGRGEPRDAIEVEALMRQQDEVDDE